MVPAFFTRVQITALSGDILRLPHEETVLDIHEEVLEFILGHMLAVPDNLVFLFRRMQPY